jgi:hypothetical protein
MAADIEAHQWTNDGNCPKNASLRFEIFERNFN